jgi:hypothetical protein
MNGSTQLIAQVLEAAGTPPQDGTLITFLTTLGTVQPSQAETSGGRVVVNFLAGTASGTATITATSGGAGGTSSGTGATASASNSVKIAIGAAAVAGVSLSASPSTVSASGGSSTLTANVRDTNGNVLPGVPVSFTTDNGSLNPPVVTTDESGNARSILTTTKVAKVTATAGVAAGTGTTGTPAQTATVTVNVNSLPGVSVGAPSPASPSVGQSVTFPLTYAADATGSPIQSVTVDFGDGTQATTYPGKPSTVTHTYNSSGSFSVRATALDAFGDTSSGGTSVIVGAKPQPTVSITTNTTNPTSGTDVAFTATVTPAANSGTAIVNDVVDFGDGTPKQNLGAFSGTFSLHHVFATGEKAYNVVLTATDSNGGVGTGGTTVFVQPAPPLGVTLNASATTGTLTTIETFTATVTGLGNSVVISYLWEFGNGEPPQETTTNQITHQYPHTGTITYTAKVTITASNGGRASNTTPITP